MTTTLTRRELLGVPIDAYDLEDTVRRVTELVERGRPSQHVVMNAAKYVAAWRDPELAQIIRLCDLINADGQSVVWASRLLGRRLKARVTGVDLFFRLVEEAAGKGWRCYFLGARDEVVTEVVFRLRRRHPSLDVAGFRGGYWDNDAEVIEAVRGATPQVLFLALPSPRKEQWLSEHLEKLQVPFVMGVGGTFDIAAGRTKRSPRWLQRLGFEWAFRLIQEPRRMFPRYFVGNTLFAWGVARAAVTGRPESNPFTST